MDRHTTTSSSSSTSTTSGYSSTECTSPSANLAVHESERASLVTLTHDSQHHDGNDDQEDFKSTNVKVMCDSNSSQTKMQSNHHSESGKIEFDIHSLLF